jgi:hypothetical protein
MPLAYIQFIEGPERPERPTDPGYGIDEGARPGQGLPGSPGRPGHLPARPGRPIDPGFGWGGGERPSHPIAPGGSRPVDPGYGVDIEGGGGSAGQLPVWPVDPDHPIAPPTPGHPLPPVDPPPGTIWPPLPPSVPEGKVIALVAISGVGYRYVVLEVPQHPAVDPGYGVGTEHPDQGLPPGGRPPRPERPSQGLPPTGRPPVAGQPLPPQRPGVPPTAGQPLPRPPVNRPSPGPIPPEPEVDPV